MLFACQRGAEQPAASGQDSVAVAESVDSVDASVPKGSCRMVLVCRGVDGEPCVNLPLVLISENGVESNALTDGKGRFESFVGLGDFRVVVKTDTLDISTKAFSGTELVECVSVPCRTIRGRIMEKDGTPLQNMPLHIRTWEKDPTKGRRAKQTLSPEEPFLKTDSLGYYKCALPENVSEIQIRSCGFQLGRIPRKEFLQYPVQNFLFIPFTVRNICSEFAPSYQFFIVTKEGVRVDMQNRTELFAADSMLDSLPRASLVAVDGDENVVRKMSKRNGVFNLSVLSVCRNE